MIDGDLSWEDFEKIENEANKKEAERVSALSREEKEREILSGLDYMAHHSNQWESPDQHFEVRTAEIIADALPEQEKFTFFWATSSPFSQWHKSEFKSEKCLRYSNQYPNEENEQVFTSAEQFMMYHKAMLCLDRESAERILSTNDPRKQKEFGRALKMSEQDLRTWDYYRAEVVYIGNKAKFTQNQKLRNALITTSGTTLVEAAPNDTIWGIGLVEEDKKAHSRETWKGKNLLGDILTRIRMEITNEY